MKKGEECHCEFVVLFRRCRVRELREELSWAEHKQTELQRGIVILAAVHGELQDSQGAVADCTEALKLRSH
jgi:hypothetical protein